MHHLHPTLGQRADGRRWTIYLVSAILAVIFAGALWLLVILDVLPGTPTDIYASWVIFFVLWVPFIALWDNPGQTRTRVEKFSEFGFIWLFISGLTQTYWELPWFVLDLTGLIHNVTAEDGWAWLWWSYGGADTRYITSNPTIAGLEFMAGFSGPFELLGWYLYFFGKTAAQRAAGCWLALCIGVGLTYLTGVFFVAEWHVDWVNIEQGAIGFWLKFVGLNAPWLVAPIIAVPAAIMELAHIYRLEGYEAAKAEIA